MAFENRGVNVGNREIPLSVPNLGEDIVSNLKECVETGWVSTGGRFIEQFEKDFASYVNVPSAVSLQSGTSGLHLALKVLRIGEGDGVIVPTLTFIATVNPLSYVGAVPFFMDCDDTFCMDMEKLERFLKEECSSAMIHKVTGVHIKAIMPVHIFGNLCDMEKLMDLADKYGLNVIEDATECLGSYYLEGKYKGRYGGTVGDIGVYSFNANKIITTGGGGMAVAKDKGLLEKIRYLSITAKDDPVYFVHNEAGFNYRMLNIQAALGVSQLKDLETFIKAKESNFRRYEELLSSADGLYLLPFRGDIRANYWFYSLYVDKEECGVSRDELMEHLLGSDIQCRPVWKLCHKQKPYEGFTSYMIEKALDYEANVLNIPCSTNITFDEISLVCDEIMKGLEK